MAGKRSTPAQRRAQPGRKGTRTNAVRRAEIRINREEIDYPNRLEHLMVAQRKVPEGFETVYRASQEELLRAGLPPVVLQQPTSRAEYAFRLDGRDATLARRGDLFELTLQWDDRGPWYHSQAHPALAETARMILIDAGRWLRDYRCSHEGPEYGLVQTDRLLDAGASYYGPRTRKYLFDPEELRRLNDLLHCLARAVQMADIHLVEPPILPKPRKPRALPPAKRARLAMSAKDDRTLQSVLASAARKAEKKARKETAGGRHDDDR